MKIQDIRLQPITNHDLVHFNDVWLAKTKDKEYDIRLSDNFLLSEFIKTSYYQFNNGIPSATVFHNICMGVQFILQPLRDKLGKPIIVTSGYRSPLVNSCVGGKPGSQHRYGQAADIKVDPLYYRRLTELIRTLPYDQILTNERSKWLHVSWTSQDYCAGGRKQYITDYYN